MCLSAENLGKMWSACGQLEVRQTDGGVHKCAHLCTRVVVFTTSYITRKLMLIIIGNVYFKNSIYHHQSAAMCHIFTKSVSNVMHVSINKQLVRCLNYFRCVSRRCHGKGCGVSSHFECPRGSTSLCRRQGVARGSRIRVYMLGKMHL